MKRVFISSVLLALFLFMPMAQARAAKQGIDSLPTPQLVEESRDTLLLNGCLALVTEGDNLTVDTPDGWQHIAPRDWVVGEYIFCSSEVVGGLTVKEGEVEGWLTAIGAVVGGIPGAIAGSLLEGATLDTYQGVLSALSEAHASVRDWFLAAIASLVAWYITAVSGSLTGILASMLNHVVGEILTNSPIGPSNLPKIQPAFNFVLSLTNIGFLIALLAMATMMVLKPFFPNFSVGRALPRLLLAALLVNFSLVIAGVIIDASRLLMAILVNVLADGENFSTMSYNFLRASRVFTETMQLIPVSGGFNMIALRGEYRFVDEPNEILYILMSLFMILVIGVGMLVLVVAMFIRYVILTLLLIFAPLPYVLMLFPATAGLAKKWWQTFFKYVALGPLLFLLLIIFTMFQPPSGDVQGGFVQSLFNSMAAAAVLGLGTVAALKTAGAVGGKVLTDTATKGGRALMPGRLTGKAGLAAGKFGAKQAGYQAKGFAGAIGKSIKQNNPAVAKWMDRLGVGDKGGKSLGQSAGEWMTRDSKTKSLITEGRDLSQIAQPQALENSFAANKMAKSVKEAGGLAAVNSAVMVNDGVTTQGGWSSFNNKAQMVKEIEGMGGFMAVKTAADKGAGRPMGTMGMSADDRKKADLYEQAKAMGLSTINEFDDAKQLAQDVGNEGGEQEIIRKVTLKTELDQKGVTSQAQLDNSTKLGSDFESFASSGGFRNDAATSGFNAKQLAAYAKGTGNKNNLRQLISNIDKVSSAGRWSGGDFAAFTNAISDNGNLELREKMDFINKVQNMLQRREDKKK